MRNITNRLRSEQGGFSLVEMMISSAVTLIVLAETMTAFNHALRAHETVTLLADSNQALRAGTAFMVRDLMMTGNGIPTGGIPIPTGPGSQPVSRPSPPGTAYVFDANLGVLPALTPGPDLGPDVVGSTTDMVTILYEDNRLDLSQYTLTSIASDGSSMTVDARTNINNPNTRIVQGDLIMFSNALGYALREVTRTVGQVVHFEGTDVSNLNQTGGSEGTILQLKTGTTFPPTSAYRVKMITYYLDKDTDPDAPRLVRQENYWAPRAMSGAMDDLQITYDIVDGVDNPTNVDAPTGDTTPNQIRKVNLQVGVRSENETVESRKFKRGTIKTQVSLRSLAFVNRYE
jgi:hypothetical protein